MRYQDKVVWITGASSGIGEALAVQLAGEGARLILSARPEDVLREVAERCGGDDRARVLPLDLAKPEAMADHVAEGLQLFGPIDLLVNNAGVSQRSLAVDTDWTIDERLMRVNFLGPVALTKALMPSMIERGSGHIAAVTSVMGKFGAPLRSGYAASKHALHGFFDALRAEVAPSGLFVTLVVPGFVHTRISMNALTADGSAQGTMDQATEGGIPAEVCARRIADALARRDREVVIAGSRERLGLALSRVAPGVLAKRLETAKVT